jgi:hypothetical protein
MLKNIIYSQSFIEIISGQIKLQISQSVIISLLSNYYNNSIDMLGLN